MSKISELKEFTAQIERDIKSIKGLKTLNEVSDVERSILDGLRGLQLKANQVYRDLYDTCQEQRRAIKLGNIAPAPQEEAPVEHDGFVHIEEDLPKPVKKAKKKKTSKKK